MMHEFPGAVLAAITFELGKRGFVLYLGRLADFEAVYGSLSSIVVLLAWLFLSAFVLIFGAEYNIVRWRARTGGATGDADDDATGQTSRGT